MRERTKQIIQSLSRIEGLDTRGRSLRELVEQPMPTVAGPLTRLVNLWMEFRTLYIESSGSTPSLAEIIYEFEPLLAEHARYELSSFRLNIDDILTVLQVVIVAAKTEPAGALERLGREEGWPLL